MNSPYAMEVNQIHDDIVEIQSEFPDLLHTNHTGTTMYQVQSGKRKVEVVEIDRLTKYYLVRDAWRMNVDQQIKDLMNVEEAA